MFRIPRSPFDLKHPVGYLLGVAIQYMIFLNTFIMTACAVSMGFGVYLLFMSMCDDINNNLDTFSRLIKSEKNPAFIVAQFSEFIQLHSSVKQLSCYFHANTIILVLKNRFTCNIHSSGASSDWLSTFRMCFNPSLWSRFAIASERLVHQCWWSTEK